ncbi:hypothetical protein FGG79_11540 [Bacillus sp. BHET2]|uniref:hypothetical protein n=1 Tax=Bacillus sp. BHET2 TaxID=2583818 RepID=UPI00110E8CFB|nr:hypothetical protein [Bacillus sp. BHET2]TMU85826.1 hypothetical protein FGG79_11540 [Bacillus sp. BHET2]
MASASTRCLPIFKYRFEETNKNNESTEGIWGSGILMGMELRNGLPLYLKYRRYFLDFAVKFIISPLYPEFRR